MVSPALLALAVFALYTVAVVALKKPLQERGVTVMGPLLMVRTQRGKELVERAARHARFWRAYGSAGTWLVVAGMAIMLALVLVINGQSILRAIQGRPPFPPPSPLTRPEAALLLPGLNPFVPLLWGIVGIAVAVLIHELGHAILTRVEGLTLKSMGLLLALVPIGAFAEPDEEELFGVRKKGAEPGPPPKKIAGQKERLRILSAGVTGNFLVGGVCLALLFAFVLPGFAPASPTELWVREAGPSSALEAGDVVLLNGQPVKAGTDLDALLAGMSGQKARFQALSGRSAEFAAPGFDGVRLASVQAGSAGDAAGLRAGDTILAMDGTDARSLRAFQGFMKATVPGQAVTVATDRGAFRAVLGEREIEGKKAGFLGVTGVQVVAGVVLDTFPARAYLEVFSSVPRQNPLYALPLMMALPFIGGQPGFTPFAEPVSNFYQPTGALASLGSGAFHLANLLLWVGWINLIVGLFNCLPAVPLDGGHVFRELVRKFLRRLRVEGEERRERMSSAIVRGFALFIFLSLFVSFLGPNLPYG